MEVFVKMEMWNEEGVRASVTTSFDDDNSYAPEEVANIGERLMRGYGYPEDLSCDIQSIGWERFVREKPVEIKKYLVSFRDGQYMKSDMDEWDGTKFIKYGNKVVFWAYIPSSIEFWSNEV